MTLLERLREEPRMGYCLTAEEKADLFEYLEQAELENRRLREALHGIAGRADSCMSLSRPQFAGIRELARQALAPDHRQHHLEAEESANA